MIDIEQDILGFTANGEPVIIYSLINSIGAKAKFINIGAAVVGVEVPNGEGELTDVVLGYRNFEDYQRDPAALGKSVGRYAGRIANGRFTLNDKEYRLGVNNGRNHLHGGAAGFQSKVWGARVEGDTVVFSYQSADGEENYPASLGVEVTYSWSEDCELKIEYMAKPSDDTICNLTNHSYFNLNGECSGDINAHQLWIDGDNYLPLDKNMIPTGEISAVEGGVMDFRAPKPLGEDIEKENEQLEIGNGYDHCWVVNNWTPGEMREVAKLYSENSGIELTISSTQPGVQVYTGNYLYGTGVSKCGKEHDNRQGVAIECQNFPDSPNKLNFPTPILRAEEIYYEQIAYKFSVK